MTDKEMQDGIWHRLSPDLRTEIKTMYSGAVHLDCGLYRTGTLHAFENIFGHHNLDSDEEPEEMLTLPRKRAIEEYEKATADLSRTGNLEYQGRRDMVAELFGKDKCLPDPSEEKPTPKFKCGDSVLHIPLQIVYDVVEYDKAKDMYELSRMSGVATMYANESDLAPYTEPETQQTEEDMEEKESGKEVNFPTKEINLSELLKDAIGEEIYSPTFGVVKVTMANCNCIGVDPWNHNSKSFQPNGKYVDEADADISLFPSRDLYLKYPLEAAKAWSEWKSERTPKRWRAKDGEYYYRFDAMFSCVKEMENGGSTDNTYYGHGNYFQTREECFKAAEAVKRTLEEFHSKNAEK